MSELKIVPRSFQRNVYAAVEYVSGKSLYPNLVMDSVEEIEIIKT